VLAGLDWAAGIGAAAMATAAVDTPFLPQDLVVRLRAAGLPAVARGADGRLHPTFALWPVTLRDRLRAALARGEHRVMAFARAEGAALAAFPDTIPDPFFNVNTPDDLARAETLPAPAP
jgi:molybdopterin-guanine dinucleotide biosynthesis protein A